MLDGSWRIAHYSGLMAHGSWLMAHGQDRGGVGGFETSSIKHHASSIKHQEASIKHQASSIKHQSSRIKKQASSIKHRGVPEPGFRTPSMVHGFWLKLACSQKCFSRDRVASHQNKTHDFVVFGDRKRNCIPLSTQTAK